MIYKSAQIKFSLYIIAALLLGSCASNPYATTNRMHKTQAKVLTKQLTTFPPEEGAVVNPLHYGEEWVGTTNFNLRKPNFVVIHHTEQDSLNQTLYTFTLPRTQVSAHYVIGKNGEVYHMLNDYYRAWHAGVGKWGNDTDLNSTSLGIELDNNGEEEFTLIQIESLLKLLENLKEKYNIPDANFIGHSDIAPSRKVDPNRTFPWKRLAEEGYGLWYDDPLLDSPRVIDVRQLKSQRNDTIFIRNDTIPISEDEEVVLLDPELALRIIGFDTQNMDAAIQAFKLHFIQKEINTELTEEDLKILNNLYRKYM